MLIPFVRNSSYREQEGHSVTTKWRAMNPEFEGVVREAFSTQAAMSLIGATLTRVEPGFVEIELPVKETILTNVPGLVHGGVVGMIADSAIGLSALTLVPAGQFGVTAEYKINMLAPALGEKLVARGYVVKPGKKLSVGRADVYAVRDGGGEKLVAMLLGTLARL
jgi:uncharacterized protein (TIGR00369 family)